MSTFLTIALIHLLGVASPGPDFLIVTRNTLTYSKRCGIATALGLGLGILVHVGYTLLGIGLLISKSIVLFNTIKYVGAAYLIFIGWKAMTHRKTTMKESFIDKKSEDITPMQAMRIGFLTNVLNPKVSLFFLALFTQVIRPETPLWLQTFYGLYMSFATFVWFSGVASLFSLSSIKRGFARIQTAAERMMGAVLIALGLKIALSSRE
ncbi:LysE family translocator [Candidatus Peribacteria bacterium]|nr:LysE family translocator [Candidatus Peribacteria bacterium]